MSKDNRALAKKIVEQHAIVFEVEAFDTFDKPTKDDPDNKIVKPSKVPKHAIEIPIIGYPLNTLDGTDTQVRQQMADTIAAHLDDGTLDLAEGWGDTNLT